MCVHMQGPEVRPSVFILFHLTLLRQGLALNLIIAKSARMAAPEPRDLLVSVSHALQLWSKRCVLFLHGSWGSQLRPSCMHRKHLSHLIISHVLCKLFGWVGSCGLYEHSFVEKDTEVERLVCFLHIRGGIECTGSESKTMILFRLPQGGCRCPNPPALWLS